MTFAIPAAERLAPAAFTAAELRLRRHAEFQRVYNATKKQHGKQMSFFAAPREVLAGEYAGPRVGLTVGRVMGKAHTRNRIKRRLREAVRAEQAALKGLPLDVVLHPRRSVETLPFAQLRAEVAEVFRRSSKRSGESAGRGVAGAGRGGVPVGSGAAGGGESAGPNAVERRTGLADVGRRGPG